MAHFDEKIKKILFILFQYILEKPWYVIVLKKKMKE